MATDARGAPTSTAREVQAAVSAHAAAATLVEARIPALGARADGEDQPLNNGAGAAPVAKDPQCLVAGYEMIYGPGRTVSGAPFHPLPLAISFFFMWAISGAGQPGTMVRLMAFKDSITWRRAIFTVTIYFGLIYFPLVVIFVAAQGIIHPAELSLGADQIMPTLAIKVAPPLIAGILIAAPFAAVMSTVDSFLLVISSGLVRDIYQRTIRPTVAERTMKLASFSTTAGVGILVAVLALNPPRFLQTIIVFTGAGFAATFLAPFFLGAYWKRMNALGAWSAMFCGFVSVVLLSATMPVLNRLRFDVPSREIHLFGLHPLVIGLALSFAGGIIGSLLGPPLPRELERRFFAAPQDAGAIVEP
jgi:SSS family solute:Na+ symporter/sodium/pantothenate symporter